MNEITLESLAQRIEVLERALRQLPSSEKPGPNDWLTTVGMFRDSDTMRAIDEEGRKIREAEREAARRGDTEQ